MADPRMLRRLKTVVFWQEIQFISIISIQKQMQRDQFPTKNEGYGGKAINYLSKNEGFGPRGFPSKNEGRGAVARHLFLLKNEGFIPRGFPFKN